MQIVIKDNTAASLAVCSPSEGRVFRDAIAVQIPYLRIAPALGLSITVLVLRQTDVHVIHGRMSDKARPRRYKCTVALFVGAGRSIPYWLNAPVRHR